MKEGRENRRSVKRGTDPEREIKNEGGRGRLKK
jgi:hypothetical protein